MLRARTAADNSCRALGRVHWGVLLVLLPAGASAAARLLMDWIANVGRRVAGGADPQSANIQKLRAYHELAKEAVERAYAADVAGERERAARLYAKGLEIIQEALALKATSLGLNTDNVSTWRAELGSWQRGVQDRVRVLESRMACSSGGARGGGGGGGASISPAPSLSVILRAPSPAAPPPPAPAAAAQLRPRAPAAAPATAARRRPAAVAAGGGGAAAPGGAAAARAAIGKEEERLRQIILAEVLDRKPSIGFDDIAGLRSAKQALQEAVILPSLRADIFKGLRAPVRGILLYGPPGNGKTMLAKALAAESRATFFNISAASLTSKWVGEGEKLVRELFALAAEAAPSIVFMDEIDSLLSARGANEHDAARRLKTEFLVQFDGVATGDAPVVVIGATNRPAELDDAARRRLVKRIYIPLPDAEGREAILRHLLGRGTSAISASDVSKVVRATEGYSASDLTALCREAALGPVRELGPAIRSVAAERIRPIRLADFSDALQVIRPSIGKEQLRPFEEFTRDFGTA
ncbi:MAG: AAA-domain-containing protein [Monoraphidium minutum]|nr:MAG: AAA-domain-containing protein [Monoraphidium minutum]